MPLIAALLYVLVIPSAPADDDWKRLIDGQSLKGWKQRGGAAKYRVENAWA